MLASRMPDESRPVALSLPRPLLATTLVGGWGCARHVIFLWNGCRVYGVMGIPRGLSACMGTNASCRLLVACCRKTTLTLFRQGWDGELPG